METNPKMKPFSPSKKIAIFAALILVFYLLFEFVWSNFSNILLPTSSSKSVFILLYTNSIFLFISIVFANLFDEFSPRLSILKILTLSGLLIFAIQFLRKIMFYVYHSDLNMGYPFSKMLIGSLKSTLLCTLIINVCIHYFRKKGLVIPIVILLLYIIVLYFLWT